MEIDNFPSRGSNKVRSLLNPKTGQTKSIIENVNATLFHDIFEVAKNYTENGELVDLHSIEDYQNTTNYLSDDGLSGFSITQDGDLISVFNLDTRSRGFLKTIAPIIKDKVKTLDCYMSDKQPLSIMYKKIFDFKVASIMDYNMEYDHDDIALNHNNPQVAFMVNVESEIETKHFNKDQYDDAVEYQKQCLESVKIKQQNSEDWITIKGNHIKLKDGETKEQAVKRFIEEKEKQKITGYEKSDPENAVNITGDKLGKYKDIKELCLKAIEYYKNNLAGSSVEHKELGKVIFTTRGYKKPISFSADERKLKLFPFLPQIIKNGIVIKKEDDTKGRTGVLWIIIRSNIVLNGKKEKVRINLRQDDKGKIYYDHVINNTPSGTAYNASQSWSCNSIIEENKYIVNLFIET